MFERPLRGCAYSLSTTASPMVFLGHLAKYWYRHRKTHSVGGLAILTHQEGFQGVKHAATTRRI